jgi:hypothetical protein
MRDLTFLITLTAGLMIDLFIVDVFFIFQRRGESLLAMRLLHASLSSCNTISWYLNPKKEADRT